MSTEAGNAYSQESLEYKFNNVQLNPTNSLVTLANLALNSSNSDRDHCYSVDSKTKRLNNNSTFAPVILDKDTECLIQKEKDHSYAIKFDRPTKSVNNAKKKSIPGRSSSEENVFRNFDSAAFFIEPPSGIRSKKSQSYEEILREPTTEGVRKDSRSIRQLLIVPTLSENAQEPLVKHLKVTGDLASPKLPRKDHTYAVLNMEPYDVEIENKRKSYPHYDDHMYNKMNKSIDIPLRSSKSDHSYYNGALKEGVITGTKSDKTDRVKYRSDHTYFSLA